MNNEPITLAIILDRLKTPWALTPRETVDFYLWLASENARITMLWADEAAKVAQMESASIQAGSTSAQAKQLANATTEGIAMMRYKAELAAIQELIRSLKRCQQYFSEEMRGLTP